MNVFFHHQDPSSIHVQPPLVGWTWVALALSLAACGGSQSDSAERMGASSSPATSPTQQTAAPSGALARGAELSSFALAYAEKQALAADASDAGQSSNPLSELPPGQIAAKRAYTSGAVARKAAATRIPVYRFYNGSTGAHFYTTSETERDHVINKLSPPFSFEGPAFSVASDFSPGLSPVYRFFNTDSGVHFYTISEAERAYVMVNLPQFNYEGVAYHASQVAGAGLIPFYRFFVPSKGFHFYTASEAERAHIQANMSATYRFEGIGYHVLDTNWRAEKLPHTGITNQQCYQPGSSVLATCTDGRTADLNPHQDGHRNLVNSKSYSTVNGLPRTFCFRDDVTGLIWEGKEGSGPRAGSNVYTNMGNGQSSDTSGYMTAINGAKLCGFSDWRLPSRNELLSLVDHSRISGPAVDTAWLPNTAFSAYWTGDPLRSDPSRWWMVRFEASNSGDSSNVLGENSLFPVRLVRGNPPSGPRFTFTSVADHFDAANNVVNDAWTGLQWRRCEEGRVWDGNTCNDSSQIFNFTHELALAYAKGRGGWRLPNINELASLTDLNVNSGASIDPVAFPAAAAREVWSSTPLTNSPFSSKTAIFSDGYLSVTVRGNTSTYTNVVRLVRVSQ